MVVLRFKHLLPGEVSIWKRFLSEYGSNWAWYEYDIHLGSGIEIFEYWDEKIKKLAKALTQYRIDVIGHREGSITIFEIKPDTGLSALGQVLSYKVLYERDIDSDVDIDLAIVTDRISKDIIYIYNKYNISIYIV